MPRRDSIMRMISGLRRRRDEDRRRRMRRMTTLHTVADSPSEVAPGVTETDLRMMDRAIELAEQAAVAGEVPVGAVIYLGDEIIAEAANNREATKDPVGHAELLAMSEAGQRLKTWRLNDCSLAVTLEPCPMCAGAMVNARLSRLIYGTTDPKAGACHTLFAIPTDTRLNHKVEVIGGVKAARCRRLLQSFFRQRRAAKKKRRRAAAG